MIDRLHHRWTLLLLAAILALVALPQLFGLRLQPQPPRGNNERLRDPASLNPRPAIRLRLQNGKP